jgi:hypothetical protein
MPTTADAAPSLVETTSRRDAVLDAPGGSVRSTPGGWTANASRLVASVAVAFGVSVAFGQWMLAGRGLRGETDIVG